MDLIIGRLAPMHIISELTGNIHRRDADDNPEGVATSCCLLEVRFQFITNTNNNNGCGHGEHTGLFSQKNALTPRRERMRKMTHEDQGGIQIFIIMSRPYLSTRAETCRRTRRGCCRPLREVLEESCIRFKCGTLQTGDGKHGHQRFKGGGGTIEHTLLD